MALNTMLLGGANGHLQNMWIQPAVSRWSESADNRGGHIAPPPGLDNVEAVPYGRHAKRSVRRRRLRQWARQKMVEEMKRLQQVVFKFGNLLHTTATQTEQQVVTQEKGMQVDFSEEDVSRMNTGERQAMDGEETDAQEEYEAFMEDSKKKREADAACIADKEGTKAELETELQGEDSSRQFWLPPILGGNGVKFTEVLKMERVAAAWLGSRRLTPENAAEQYLRQLDQHTDLLDERSADLHMIRSVVEIAFRNIISTSSCAGWAKARDGDEQQKKPGDGSAAPRR